MQLCNFNKYIHALLRCTVCFTHMSYMRLPHLLENKTQLHTYILARVHIIFVESSSYCTYIELLIPVYTMHSLSIQICFSHMVTAATCNCTISYIQPYTMAKRMANNLLVYTCSYYAIIILTLLCIRSIETCYVIYDLCSCIYIGNALCISLLIFNQLVII